MPYEVGLCRISDGNIEWVKAIGCAVTLDGALRLAEYLGCKSTPKTGYSIELFYSSANAHGYYVSRRAWPWEALC